MRVEIKIRPWIEDHEAEDPNDGVATLVADVLFDGRSLTYSRASIEWPKSRFSYNDGALTGWSHGFMELWLEDINPTVFALLQPHQILVGSTAKRCGFPVAALDVALAVPR